MHLFYQQCCAGLTMLNTNMSAEMAKLMIENQERYVSHVDNETMPIFFDGDELTEERARNVQWAFTDGDNDEDCLKGLDPNHTCNRDVIGIIISIVIGIIITYYNKLVA